MQAQMDDALLLQDATEHKVQLHFKGLCALPTGKKLAAYVLKNSNTTVLDPHATLTPQRP